MLYQYNNIHIDKTKLKKKSSEYLLVTFDFWHQISVDGLVLILITGVHDLQHDRRTLGL